MTSETTFDILVAGEINPDLILSGNVVPEFGQVEKLVDTVTLAIGSSSAIFACGAARLGLRVAFVGVCGDDVFGNFMRAEMQKRNVDVSHVIVRPGGQTGLSLILNRGADRAILTYLGLAPSLRVQDIPEDLLRQTRHLHVASYFLQTNLHPDLPGLFRRARSFTVTTSLDTNYDPSEEWRGVDELLPLTSVFMPNEREARSLTGADSVEEAGNTLMSRSETVAIKLGAQGALGVNSSGNIRVASIPIQVVDTIGAGDSFDAGFIYGYLQGWSMERSLRLACVCGALSTQQAGGTDGQPTLEEALALV